MWAGEREVEAVGGGGVRSGGPKLRWEEMGLLKYSVSTSEVGVAEGSGGVRDTSRSGLLWGESGCMVILRRSSTTTFLMESLESATVRLRSRARVMR